MKVIIGPSCVGKSTYIKQLQDKNSELNVVYGYTITKDSIFNENDLVHYNILHYHTVSEAKNEDIFFSEKIFNSIFSKYKLIDEVVVLVTPINELIKRAKNRKIIEIGIDDVYNSNYWLDKIHNTNFYFLYHKLVEYLNSLKLNIKYIYSDNNTKQFLETDSVYICKNLNGKYVSLPTYEEVIKIANMQEFHYQELDMPFGIKTRRGSYEHLSTTRTESFVKFQDLLLDSNSVLDIGSAIGELSFFAEKLGCKEIVALEKEISRYTASIIAKKILHSDVEIFNQDFFEFSLEKKYECVACLNVLHHIDNFQKFIRKICELSSKYIVLEVPGLADQKFLDLYNLNLNEINHLDSVPLIGVSSPTSVDQYFVFTISAIQMLIKQYDNNFELINKINSPIKGRYLAVFKKNEINDKI